MTHVGVAPEVEIGGRGAHPGGLERRVAEHRVLEAEVAGELRPVGVVPESCPPTKAKLTNHDATQAKFKRRICCRYSNHW